MPSKWARMLLTSCAALLFVLRLLYADSALNQFNEFESIWSELLSHYSPSGDCVDFEKWQSNSNDIKKLDRALELLGQEKGKSDIHSEVDLALLMNAYNACLIRKALKYYPMDSINSIAKFFTEKDCVVSRKEYSLSELETLSRKQGSFRVHACLWGGAKSSPPLAREAFDSDSIEGQLDRQMKRWLSVEKLNELDCDDGKIHISKVFLWYKDDFGNDDEKIKNILFQYGPSGAWREKVKKDECKIEYIEFDHGISKDCSAI